MKMKFMAVNARDGENVEKAVLTLVTDTIAHQKAHCNDVVDPWATPHADNEQPVRDTIYMFFIVPIHTFLYNVCAFLLCYIYALRFCLYVLVCCNDCV